MINASDKTEPAGPSPSLTFPISRPLFSRLLFSYKFGHAIPEVTDASEFMSLVVVPRFAKMYITTISSTRDIGIEKKTSFSLYLLHHAILFMKLMKLTYKTYETHVYLSTSKPTTLYGTQNVEDSFSPKTK